MRLCESIILSLSLTVYFSAGAGAAESATPSTEHVAYFEQHVRPLLVAECYECHSAQAKILQGGLLLDSRAGWQKGGDSGPAIVPGKPDDSLLVRAVQYHKDEFIHMPPKGKLDAKQIAALVEWVRLGAPDPRTDAPPVAAKREINVDEGKKYWAFQPLRPVAVPEVQDAAWCRTPVDYFIQAKLEAAGIAANPSADARTLVRRAYFDLVGLPPTPAEVDEFVGNYKAATVGRGSGPDRDQRSRLYTNAYDALLDRLLASPHYGERWGRHWLDLARFGESHGFEQDYDRPTAYHYRDFVIEALNRDLPYDTFVKWQLAGDEYEPKNPLALKATGFLAAGVHATQITANQAEKERYDELDDMTRTVGTTMLGLTVGCARCHDHKYDPITNLDYYRMVSTFTTTVRSDADVNLNPEAHRQAVAKFEREHRPLVEVLTEYERGTVEPQFDAWLNSGKFSEPESDWIVLVPSKATGPETVTFTIAPDGTVRSVGSQFFSLTYSVEAPTKLGEIAAVRLEALADDALPGGGPGTAVDGAVELRNIKITAVAAAKPDKGEPPTVDAKIARLTATHDATRKNVADGTTERPDSWKIAGKTARDQTAVFEFDKPVGFAGGTSLRIAMSLERNYQGIGRFRLAVRTTPQSDASPRLDGATITEPARQVLAALVAEPRKKLNAKDRAALLAWYRTQDAEWRRLNDAVAASESRRPRPEVAKMLISSEGVPAVRLHTQGPDFYDKTYMLRRGDPNQKVEEVSPGFLQVLMRSPDGEKHWQTPPPTGSTSSYRRTALAEWITDVDAGAGALLARVIVNRLWYHHVGTGLVATPSDFGVQAGPPSHPELLEYVAGELVRNGWRLKPIHKLIMTSAVYMQTSNTDAARRAVDVDNRLYWHRDWRRLEGEIIRDAMLAVSGTLDDAMFGPGTLDPNMRRRSIYFFIKRSKLVPMLSLFDGPDTLQDLAVRGETTVAPQALLLLNNTTVRDLATAFAQRIAPQSPGDVEASIAAGYRLALSREPTAEELRATAAFVVAQSAAYREEGKAADADLTAWADFCQVLFGLNEFVYVE